MRSRLLASAVIVAGLTAAVAASVHAFPQYARETKAACAACHVIPAGGHELTDAGKAYKAEKKAPTGDAPVAEYVGVNKCKMCHIKQYTAYKTHAHAHAFATLQGGDAEKQKAMATALKVELKGSPAKDENCVVCHVTGFQLPGGYPSADTAKTAALVNVTCESCHGPGSKHVAAAMADKKKFINKNVSAEMCTQCHTAATSPNFKFDEYKAKIVHWKTD